MSLECGLHTPETNKMKELLHKAITTHSHWKYNLQQAIKTGKSSVTVNEVKNAHLCELGKLQR